MFTFLFYFIFLILEQYCSIVYLIFRANNPNERPSFRDLLLTLPDKDSSGLRIPMKERNSSTQAGTLGAPLQAGYGMYTDLQRTYISN